MLCIKRIFGFKFAVRKYVPALPAMAIWAMMNLNTRSAIATMAEEQRTRKILSTIGILTSVSIGEEP
jgi:hypothetical protein